MDCKQVEKMIPQFLDDDLTTEELREFMEHIENCTDCKEELTIEFLVSEGLVRLENGAVFDLQKELSECIAAAERHLHWRENIYSGGTGSGRSNHGSSPVCVFKIIV